MINQSTSIEQQYNLTLNNDLLSRSESLSPADQNLLCYSSPKDICQGIEVGRLGNMAGGFHFDLLGAKWYGTEHLYLCGEWSTEGAQSIEIQNYIRKMCSGVYAKRCSKGKYKALIRPDFNTFRHQWMLWCVWQKCIHNQEFAKLLKSMPEDAIIVEVVKRDPVWAAYPDETGIIQGGNAMGKILTICRRHLLAGTTPEIDTDLLNQAGIYILGKRVDFTMAA